MGDFQSDTLLALRAFAASRGGECVSEVLGDPASPLRWRCALAHEWSAPAKGIEKRWCPVCAADMRGWAANVALLRRALGVASANRGTCVSEKYSGSADILRWRCAEGHEWAASVPVVAGGEWCADCHRKWLEETAAHRARQRAGIPERAVSQADLAKILDVTRPRLLERVRGVRRRGGDVFAWSAVWHLLTEAQRDAARAHAARPPRGRSGARAWVAGYPALVAEWHPTRNGELTPAEVRWGSGKPIWWRCRAGHVWEAKPHDRAGLGHGCPYCSGKRVSAENSLAKVDPKTARHWHPTKNGELTPRDVTAKSSQPVWWKCPRGPDHEWLVTVADRRRAGCPFCTGNRVSVTNCLQTRFPEVAAQWHPRKNGSLTPSEVMPFSGRKVWWVCSEGHEWIAPVADRSNSKGCPYCSGRLLTPARSLAARAPATARLWHPTRNGTLRPRDVSAHSSRLVWWRCPAGPDHEWECAVAAQVIHKRCAFCCNRRVSVTNSLATRSPAVAREWHPKKNGGKTPRDFVAVSKEVAWWRCARGHEWQAPIVRRAAGRGCPRCGD